MKNVKLETILAMLLIAWLETLAILKGIDGTLLSAAIGVIAALGGYYVGKRK